MERAFGHGILPYLDCVFRGRFPRRRFERRHNPVPLSRLMKGEQSAAAETGSSAHGLLGGWEDASMEASGSRDAVVMRAFWWSLVGFAALGAVAYLGYLLLSPVNADDFPVVFEEKPPPFEDKQLPASEFPDGPWTNIADAAGIH